MNTVVFGAFDLLHEGHLAFLNQAAATHNDVIVVLAQDAMIHSLKGRNPVQDYEVRKAQLEALESVQRVVSGDKTLGTYEVFNKVQPDLIFLGYDQTALGEDLVRFMQERGLAIPIKIAESHEPERFKTSLLREQL